MAEQEFKVTAVVRTLDDERVLAEALFFPEASCLAPRAARADVSLARHVRELLLLAPLGEVYRRRGAGTPEVVEVELVLDPPRPTDADARAVDGAGTPPEAWVRPVPVRFHAVRWRHGEQAHVAFVPALGIEVIGATADELAQRLPQHVRFALVRSGAASSLWQLAHAQRARGLSLRPVAVPVTFKSPKRLATDAARAESESQDKPVLEQVGVDLTRQTLPRAWELDAVVAQVADALTGRSPRSVLLVGRSGVGKTATVHELVRQREAMRLGQTPFWATSGSRLVAGMSGFGMWQERCQRLCREASKGRAVLYLGNLIELIEVGKSTHNAQGIASFLRPYLARGEVLAIAECTPEQLAVIERMDPHLVEVFHAVKVEEPPAEVAKVILLNVILAADTDKAPASPMDEEALEAVDALHRRYATYSAVPARPIRFVRNLMYDRRAARSRSRGEHWTPPPATLGRADVIKAFARETGLPLFLLDAAVPLDLAAARAWFAARVIGQDDAVDLVVDVIATVKAALNRPRRPIASLLFIGPTGVGKTEMAKALAEYFFGDRERLARFDMSEFATPSAVERLVGGVAGQEGLLTARVREQPFSVVLLDEFEKAHPALFDLLLQVLGEGRLTDAAGRVADFGNAVIVMTSNLGAGSYQQTPFGLTRRAPDGRAVAREACEHFVEAVRDHFRPEMFNRIDRVVPFAPLGEEVVLSIARRELDLVRRRDGLRLRAIDLHLPEEAVRYLAAKGFDPQYGARPLKRAIERELLVPLADGLNGYAEDARLVARVGVEGPEGARRLDVQVRAATGEVAGAPVAARTAAALPLARTTADWVALRRNVQRLQGGAAAVALQNEVFALQRLQEQLIAQEAARARARRRAGDLAARSPGRPPDDERLARLPRLLPVAEAIAGLWTRVAEHESAALLALYDSDVARPDGAATGDLATARADWDRLLLALLDLRFRRPQDVLLVLSGDAAQGVFDLARAYHGLAVAGGCHVGLHAVGRRDRSRWPDADTPVYETVAIDKPAAFLAEPVPGKVALGLVVHGPHAYARFAPEQGLHVFCEEGEAPRHVVVETDDRPWAQYALPRDIGRRAFNEPQDERRAFELDRNVVTDGLLGGQLRWAGRAWEAALAEAIDAQLERAKAGLLGEA